MRALRRLPAPRTDLEAAKTHAFLAALQEARMIAIVDVVGHSVRTEPVVRSLSSLRAQHWCMCLEFFMRSQP